MKNNKGPSVEFEDHQDINLYSWMKRWEKIITKPEEVYERDLVAEKVSVKTGKSLGKVKFKNIEFSSFSLDEPVSKKHKIKLTYYLKPIKIIHRKKKGTK